MVSFATIRARDLVYSYARNLGQCIDDDGNPTAGLRIEIPDQLLGDYKTLEQYGHAMKQKHKIGFKRHIKLDDSILGLYMDIYLPKQKEWVRIDMELARTDNAGRRAKKSQAINKKLLSTIESGEED